MFELLTTHLSLLFGFAFTCLIIELTPGPNMAYLAILTSRSGKRAGYFAVAGIAMGLLLIGCAAAIGLTGVIHSSPVAYHALRWCGIAYLFWLAWEAWRDANKSVTENAQEFHRDKYFLRGLITNLINPKAGLFYVVVLPRFVLGETYVASQMILLAIIYVAVATSIHFSIVSLASMATQFMNSDARRSHFSRIMAILLAAVAVWFGWTTQLSGVL